MALVRNAELYQTAGTTVFAATSQGEQRFPSGPRHERSRGHGKAEAFEETEEINGRKRAEKHTRDETEACERGRKRNRKKSRGH